MAEKCKPLSEFLSECSEWHALWIGFYSSFFRLKRESLPDYLRKEIEREYHYYTLGFFIGRLIQFILSLIGIKLLMK